MKVGTFSAGTLTVTWLIFVCLWKVVPLVPFDSGFLWDAPAAAEGVSLT